MYIFKDATIQNWIRNSFFNLLIVAGLGVIMRYKIAFYLPFVDQKNFLHAHSHFAFTGWVTQILMVLMWLYLKEYLSHDATKKYRWIIGLNLLCAYGMLLTFPWEGYGIVSITFSTLSILVSYIFSILFWVDLNKIKTKTISALWFKGALLFNVISSFGAFFLSYMMANKIQHPKWFLASTYFFLHFQYNGWFFFSCMGLLSEQLKNELSFSLQKKVFWLFAWSCIPAYFLSALWIPIPTWIYALVALAAVAELAGWLFLLKAVLNIWPNVFIKKSLVSRWFYILSAIALSIKLLLQLASIIPSLSSMVFGFRPVVIGYLHLMFLGVISLFIIGYCKMKNLVRLKPLGKKGVVIFISGIIANEILLMIQGLSYMNFLSLPYINELLLLSAAIIFTGVFFLYRGIQKPKLYAC